MIERYLNIGVDLFERMEQLYTDKKHKTLAIRSPADEMFRSVPYRFSSDRTSR